MFGRIHLGWIPIKAGWILVKAGWIPVKAGWILIKAGWILVKAGWIPVKAGWILVKAGTSCILGWACAGGNGRIIGAVRRGSGPIVHGCGAVRCGVIGVVFMCVAPALTSPHFYPST